MSDASWNLQVAIFSLLKNASPSIAGGRIYDDVPEAAEKADAPDTEFPYVAVGELDAIPDDVDASDGSRDDGVMETLTLHVWSRYRGQKEVKQIMQQIKNLLHDTKITVTDRSSALAEVTIMRSFIDQNGRTRHGVVTVEVTHRS